jgi:hypothetical protein
MAREAGADLIVTVGGGLTIKTPRAIEAILLAAMLSASAAAQAFAGTTTVQRSVTTANGSGASCSQANECGSCSISCPVGKSAVCQSGTDRPGEAQNHARCAPPTCFCR